MISAENLTNDLDRTKLLTKKPELSVQKKIVKDYYKFANDKWDKSHSIPAKYPSWGSFNIVSEKSKKQVEKIISDVVKKKSLSHNEQLMKNFYKSGMNLVKIEEKKHTPLVKYFNMIDTIFSLSDYIHLLPFFNLLEVTPVFRLYPMIDSKNPKQYILYFKDGSLGLPGREYYLEKKYSDECADYKKYMLDISKECGLECSASDIAKVFAFEKKLANSYLPPEKKRDVVKNYNKVEITSIDDDIISLTDYLVMTSNMTGIDLSREKNIIIENFGVVKKLKTALKNTDISVLKLHLKLALISEFAPYLSKNIFDRFFKFYRTNLYGIKEQKPRKELVIAHLDLHLWDCIGEQYVKKHFPASSKKNVEDLVKKLIASYGEKIVETEWMSPKTKKYALHKLDKMTVKIGYPEKIIDYSLLTLGDCYFENICEATKFLSMRELQKVLKPVDKKLWEMSAHMCNAYYYPELNEIVFPAGILKEPFYDPKQSIGENFGGIGVVIGHEITHGFDDQGKEYNADGVLQKWWTSEDDKNYKKSADKISAHMSEYELHGHKVKGDLTLGETIADLGGVKISFDAMMEVCKNKKMSPEQVYRERQLFFLNFARVWRNLMTKQNVINRILTDPHPPPVLRVNATLRNSPDFYNTYYIDGNSELYNKDMTKIW